YETYEQWEDKLEGVGRTLADYGGLLPAPFGDWAKQAADGSWSLDQVAARGAFGALLARYADDRVLRKSGLSVVSGEVPEAEDRDQAFLTAVAAYRLPMRMPFVGRTLVLEESARERVWIGGLPSDAKLDEAADPNAGVLTFVSIEPNPASRGRKVTLTLRAK